MLKVSRRGEVSPVGDVIEPGDVCVAYGELVVVQVVVGASVTYLRPNGELGSVEVPS